MDFTLVSQILQAYPERSESFTAGTIMCSICSALRNRARAPPPAHALPPPVLHELDTFPSRTAFPAKPDLIRGSD